MDRIRRQIQTMDLPGPFGPLPIPTNQDQILQTRVNDQISQTQINSQIVQIQISQPHPHFKCDSKPKHPSPQTHNHKKHPSTSTIEWDIFGWYQFDQLKQRNILFSLKSNRPFEERNHIGTLTLSPRFAALELAKQRAVSDVILSIIQTNTERVGRVGDDDGGGGWGNYWGGGLEVGVIGCFWYGGKIGSAVTSWVMESME